MAQAQTPGLEVIHSFGNCPNGASPCGTLARGNDGSLYGTAYTGGAADLGVVFKLDPSGEFTVLYAFTGGADGGMPGAGVIRDSAGNLFGTTQYGGFGSLCVPQALDGGCGVVFKVDPSGNETVLHAFSGTDGSYPNGIIFGAAGVLYGTASSGGAANGGVVYKLTLP